jgi:hypothetical protein
MFNYLANHKAYGKIYRRKTCVFFASLVEKFFVSTNIKKLTLEVLAKSHVSSACKESFFFLLEPDFEWMSEVQGKSHVSNII